ncbi:hypothetical protein [Hydrogenophaga sp.]|uniref:hypothetical protein n=1 Tax=Hydrogenophaga sp. TaxID=1904254 RepID=UPI003D0AC50C
MRSAPSVSFPVGRCRFYLWFLLTLAALGVLVLGAWVVYAASHRQWHGLWGAALWGSWLLFAAWSWWRSPTGLLSWEAQAQPPGGWAWRSTACVEGAPLQRVDLVVDLQTRVLLRLHGADARTRWVWAERAKNPGRWHDLRRALVVRN